jgi:hypothetical protein
VRNWREEIGGGEDVVRVLKVLGVLIGIGFLIYVVLPWGIPILAESPFMREAGIDRLADSLSSLNDQAEATREAWRRLVASARGQ